MSALLLGLDSRATMPRLLPAYCDICDLIGNADGGYHPAMFNDRSLLRPHSKVQAKPSCMFLCVLPQRRHSRQGRGDLRRGLRIRLTGDLRSRVAEEAPKGYLTVYQAMRPAGVSRQTVWQSVKRDEIEAIYVRRRRRKACASSSIAHNHTSSTKPHKQGCSMKHDPKSPGYPRLAPSSPAS
jgi:hypothetical protein